VVVRKAYEKLMKNLCITKLLTYEDLMKIFLCLSVLLISISLICSQRLVFIDLVPYCLAVM